jgi:hypothetical protein
LLAALMTAAWVCAAAGADSVLASPKEAKVRINAGHKILDAYVINDFTYFKLRDLATIFADTDKPFDVGWDAANNAVTLTTGKKYYVPAQPELKAKITTDQIAVPSANNLLLDGQSVELSAYSVNDANYFKIADLSRALGVSISYDASTDTILVSTKTN